jgi:hypothetical protein
MSSRVGGRKRGVGAERENFCFLLDGEEACDGLGRWVGRKMSIYLGVGTNPGEVVEGKPPLASNK